MGILDDTMKGVKGNWSLRGNLATPIAVAVGALILGKMFGGSTVPAPGRAAPPPLQPVPTNPPAGSVLGGLKDLISKLKAGGAAPQVDSWIGLEANQPIQPAQLGAALGQNVVNELSQRTGMSQEELLNQLAAVLPQLINHLTPNGHMPTLADLEKDGSADPLIATSKIRSVVARVANSSMEGNTELPTLNAKSRSAESEDPASSMKTARHLLNLIVDTNGASVPVTELVRKVIVGRDQGVIICLAVATALSRRRLQAEAQILCRNVHRILLNSGRDRDVPSLMLFQAKLYDYQGDHMARDLYAVEAGSGFADFHDVRGVSAALELIDS